MSTITKARNVEKASIVGVEVVEVQSKKDLLSWVRFPNQLYKDNEFFVPFSFFCYFRCFLLH